MGRRVKATKERCLTCQYVMNLTGASFVKKGESGALIACGYCLKSGDGCRTVKDGQVRDGHVHGYCNKYLPGKRRVQTFDSIINNTTIKKGKKKDV